MARSPKNKSPLIKTYLQGKQSLLDLLSAHAGPDHPLINTMLALRQSLEGTLPTGKALAQAESASKNLPSEDPHLLALFYTLWGSVALRSGKRTQAAALCSELTTLINEDFPPEIQVLPIELNIHLCLVEDHRQTAEELYQKALALLPKTSKRRAITLGAYYTFLANFGQGQSFIHQYKNEAPKTTNTQPSAQWALSGFINAVQTCNVHEADHFRQNLSKHPSYEQYEKQTLNQYQVLLDLFAAQGQSTAIARTEQDIKNQSPHIYRYTRPTLELLKNNPYEALQHARLTVDENNKISVMRTGFDNFNLIRAELSCGNAKAALALLDQANALGSHHYLDAFFLARVHLRLDQPTLAYKLFSRAYKACEHFLALNRLNFELMIAKELSPSQVMRLGFHAHSEKTPYKISSPSSWSKKSKSTTPKGLQNLLGSSAAINKTKKAISQFAPLEATVLITGETGTGKELVARALHEEGPRAKQPFLSINCAALSESLLAPELFGHVAGAFTDAGKGRQGLFETAGKGTLFLDEIGETTPAMQRTLLRVLETGEFRPVGSDTIKKTKCRVVAATHKDLKTAVKENQFREDLYYRLARLEIATTPLAKRSKDIPLLARHFLGDGTTPAKISKALAQKLSELPWPGNVRELKNTLERMKLLNSNKHTYEAKDLSLPGAPQRDLTPENVSQDFKTGNTSLRRLEAIKALFREKGSLTRLEISSHFGVSGFTATNDLKKLTQEGVIEKVKPSPSPRSHYFVWIRPAEV